jgi:2-(1,2-epoxy-1,2-dihydrophenyl)acetyl-CoA isomerase
MTPPPVAGYPLAEGLAIGLDGGVLELRLDRPAQRNAIDDTMMDGLATAVDRAGRDDEVRAILLTATGDHFCGGADIVARNAASGERPRAGSIQRRLPSQAHRLMSLLLTVQVPVVCAVRGWAAGIGLQLTLAADFAVVATDARFWEPFAARGFTPDSGATWLLPRRVGPQRAREMLLLGRELSGTDAVEWGVAYQAVPAAQVDGAARGLASQLAHGPTAALGLTRWLLAVSPDAGLEQQLRNEAFALELSSRTEDFREGLRAFSERRPPRFEGR